jgi:hypothetical protein
MREELRGDAVQGRVHGACASERDPGLRARHQREDRLPCLEGGERSAALERCAGGVRGERALREQPVEDRVLGGELHVGMEDVARCCALLVGANERVHEALPSEARDLEEERVERSPVVVEEAGRLTEGFRNAARREILAPEHRAFLEEIADERGRFLPGDRSHEKRAE